MLESNGKWVNEWSYVCGHFWEEKDPFLQTFTSFGKLKNYQKGSYIFRQGECATKVVLVLEGCVENSVLLEDGRKKVNLLYAGRVVLGLASLNQVENGTSARCLTPVKAVIADSKDVAGWPTNLLLPIAMCQTHKMQILYHQLRQRHFLKTEEQLLRILEDMKSSGMLERYEKIKLRRSMLAEMLGISRVHLGTIIALVDSQHTLTSQEKSVLSIKEV